MVALVCAALYAQRQFTHSGKDGGRVIFATTAASSLSLTPRARV
jgi:hypothetical protein